MRKEEKSERTTRLMSGNVKRGNLFKGQNSEFNFISVKLKKTATSRWKHPGRIWK